ncbi:MAG: YHYH domain-containing protein [Patescibacteria group bacterium]
MFANQIGIYRPIETFALFVILVSIPSITLAHPGRTDSSGCHTCRTNCEQWGLSYGEYHCHRAKSVPQPEPPIRSHRGFPTGYTEPAPDYANSKPQCPANSSLVGATCFCNTGYAKFNSSCIKIPTNAHAVTSGADAWECDGGYTEKGNNCVPEPVLVVSPSTSSSSSSQSSSASIMKQTSVSEDNVTSQSPLPNSIPLSESKRGLWNRIWSFLFGS